MIIVILQLITTIRKTLRRISVRGTRADIAERGENILYLGSGDFYGHGGGPPIKKLKEWQARVAEWNREGLDAPVLNFRDRPRIGLKDE